MSNYDNRKRPYRKRRLKRKYVIRRAIFVFFVFILLMFIIKSCGRGKSNDNKENNLNNNSVNTSLPAKETTNNSSDKSQENHEGNLSIENENLRISDLSVEYGTYYTDSGIEKEKRILYVLDNKKAEDDLIKLLKTSIEGQIPASFAKEESSDSYINISLNPNDNLLIKSNDLFKTSYEDIDGLYKYIYLVDKSLGSDGKVKAIFITKSNLKDDIEKILKDNNIEGNEMEIGQ